MMHELYFLVLIPGIFYFVLMIMLARGFGRMVRDSSLSAREGKQVPEHNGTVKCSVVVAARNEARNIMSLLRALAVQDYPVTHFEVIISDDDSEDNTLSLVAQFARERPGFPLKLVKADGGGVPGKGKKAAIRRAMEAVSGDVILCTDADARPLPGWIGAMTGAFKGDGTMVALGPVIMEEADSFFGRLQQTEYLGIMAVTAGSAGTGHPLTANGASLAFRREVYPAAREHPGYRKFSSGDDQFMLDAVLKKYGAEVVKFVMDRQAAVRIRPEQDIVSFLAQRTRWLSKSPGYRDGYLLAAGILTGLVLLAPYAGLIAGLFFPGLFAFAAAAWLIKVVADYAVVSGMGRFAGIPVPLPIYVASQLFQFFYVPVVALLQWFPYRWKGRKIYS